MTQPGRSSRVQLPAAGGGFFEVDISRAPDAIRDLEFARDELLSIRDEAQVLGQFQATSSDPVSQDAAEMLRQAAVTGPFSFTKAVSAGIDELSELIDDLRTAFASYSRADEAGASSLERPS